MESNTFEIGLTLRQGLSVWAPTMWNPFPATYLELQITFVLTIQTSHHKIAIKILFVI